MNGSLQTGIHFGLTSGVITTLGLMVGLHSSTHSLLAVVGGLLTIAIADAFSDTQGYRIPGGVRWSIMNILMVTNTFTPHVGGVARSVQGFASEFRKRGHRVLVLAPLFEGTPKKEQDVVRVPAVQHFSGSDFSVPMPVPGRVTAALRTFSPRIVHSHHPFLLGDTALCIAAIRNIPVVFTHHTMYEHYTHYVFASQTETQGMVLTEAMAARVPVVAVDASGVREVVRNRVNGRLLSHEDQAQFVTALCWLASLNPAERQRLREGTARTATEFSMDHTATQTLALYESLIESAPTQKEIEESPWTAARRRIEEEWRILRNITHAVGDAVLSLRRTEEP